MPMKTEFIAAFAERIAIEHPEIKRLQPPSRTLVQAQRDLVELRLRDAG